MQKRAQKGTPILLLLRPCEQLYCVILYRLENKSLNILSFCKVLKLQKEKNALYYTKSLTFDCKLSYRLYHVNMLPQRWFKTIPTDWNDWDFKSASWDITTTLWYKTDSNKYIPSRNT